VGLLGKSRHESIEASCRQALSVSAMEAAGAEALERKDGRAEVVALATT
jgi:hypothetical protein